MGLGRPGSAVFQTFSLIVALMVVALSPPARAADADKKKAQALQVEGLRLMQAGDNRAALEKFDEAFRLVASPKILFNRGKAHQALDQGAEALADFERFLDEAPYAPKESRAMANRAIEELRPTLSYLEIQADDTGSSIAVDGREIGNAPLLRPVVVAPGTHEVRVTKSGMNDEVRSVSPIAGQKLRVVVRLTAVAARETPVAAPAPAAPLPAPRVAPPPAPVVATGADVPSVRSTGTTAAAAGERPWQVTAAWVAGGAGVLLLAGGATAHMLWQAKVSEFGDVRDAPMPDSKNGTCNQKFDNDGGAHCHELAQAAETRRTLMIAGYAAGGVALAGAVILYLTAPSPSSSGHDVGFACLPTAGVSCALSMRF